MNSFIVVIMLLVIAASIIPWGMKQPKRKVKKFGDGMFVDTHAKDESSYSAGVTDWHP